MWQADTTSGYRDLANLIVQAATSKHVSAVAINAGGSGYIVGEMLTVTHAGAALDCTVEVTSETGGVVDGIKLRNMGAFSDRLASAVVNAGGSGYAVGDVLEVEGGTETQNAKVKVATLSGSAVATVTVQDGGGAYTSPPGLTGAATNNDPGSGSGTGCTLDLTMTGVIGTSGIATTSDVSGTGCTLNLTLTDTGWTAVRDWNNYSYNSLTDEKEVVLEGTVAAGDEPYIAFRSYTGEEGVDDRFGLVLFGMTSFNPGLSLVNQANFGPNGVASSGDPYTDDRSHLTVFDSSQDFWFSFSSRKIAGAVKSVGTSTVAYSPFYLGFGNPLGTTVENPYPMFISGNTSVFNRAPDEGSNYTASFLNPIAPASGITTGTWFWRLTDTSWVNVVHSNLGSTRQSNHTIYPVGESRDSVGGGFKDNIVADGPFGWFDGITDPNGGIATQLVYRTPDSGGDLFFLIPMTLIRTPSTGIEGGTIEDDVHLELDNIFWFSATLTAGTTVSPEDTFTIGTDRYRIFADCDNRERYSFFCMLEE